jgi:hypothetical protein
VQNQFGGGPLSSVTDDYDVPLIDVIKAMDAIWPERTPTR